MIGALLKVMVLGLVRDRGAFTMAFLLPPLIFAIFAAIFSGTSGDEMRLKVAIVDEVGSIETATLMAAIDADPSLRLHEPVAVDANGLRDLVLSGSVDVGLVLRGVLRGEGGEPPVLVIADGGRAMTGSILSGHVQRLIARDLPGVTMRRVVPAIEDLSGGLNQEQRARLDAGIEELAGASGGDTDAALVAIETMAGGDGERVTVSYYAGAVAVMFLLFSAMQGATTLIQDRTSGIVDRLAVGRAGTDVMVLAKFFFLSGQGLLQVGVIFVVAWLVYGVDLPGHIAPWLIVTALTAAAAAGLAVTMASACTTRQQASTVSSFLVLLASAIGGSMVPRFMMPPWLQDLGWFTPNAWAIEAYQGVLWRGDTMADLLPSFSLLATVAIAGLTAAIVLSRYRLKLG